MTDLKKARFIVKAYPKHGEPFYSIALIPSEIKDKIKIPKLYDDYPILIRDYNDILRKFNTKKIDIVGYPICRENTMLNKEYFIHHPIEDFYKIVDTEFFNTNPFIETRITTNPKKGLISAEIVFNNILITRSTAVCNSKDTFNYFSGVEVATERLCRSKITF